MLNFYNMTVLESANWSWLCIH